MHVTVVPERGWGRKFLKEIRVRAFQIWWLSAHIFKTFSKSKQGEKKKTTPQHIIIKSLKSNSKDKNLEMSQGKLTIGE